VLGLVDAGTPGNQQAGDVPATVANGVVERSADRTIRRLDIGSALDQGFGHIGVVAARRVMQRRLITRTGGLGTAAGRQGVGVGASVDQQPDDLRPVWEVAGSVGD
jgi:hypothetical protein